MQKTSVRLATAILLIAVLGMWPIKTSIGADASVSYRYDAMGRLVAASYNSGLCVVYTYDANSNRLSETTGAPSMTGTGMWGCFAWNGANWGN